MTTEMEEARKRVAEKRKARLLQMAAADLLDALEDLLPWATAYAERQRTRLHGSAEFQRITRAKAAIAKAKGVRP